MPNDEFIIASPITPNDNGLNLTLPLDVRPYNYRAIRDSRKMPRLAHTKIMLIDFLFFSDNPLFLHHMHRLIERIDNPLVKALTGLCRC
jgi:hypothetical protein